MNYAEIEKVLKENGQNSTIEQLRAAVGEEANELSQGMKNKLDEATAVEQAREFYAEDITRWMSDNLEPDPELLIGMRARYAKSWAFAQIINNLLGADEEELEVPSVNADTLVRLCLSNAEMGSKLVELIDSLQQAAHANQLANAVGMANTVLNQANAPKLAPGGKRKLAIWERVECLVEELQELRDRPGAIEEKRIYDILSAVIKTGAANLIWMAQTTHQSYHTEDGDSESWRECSKGVCGSMEHMLGQLGFTKDMKERVRIP